MSIRYKHDDAYTTYFCTFTCFNWIHLFEITQSYDLVYDWFKVLKTKYNCDVVAYVIMPNHLHVILYFREAGFSLNKIISNGKRFIAYEIIKRIQKKGAMQLLQKLSDELTEREKRKGQKHKVFTDSFDAKPIYSEKFFLQKLNYIHNNPVKGKWNLAKDFSEYEHSSASFYEFGFF